MFKKIDAGIKSWGKTKIFFILILLIGSALHIAVNISYIYIYYDLGLKKYTDAIFLISLIFIIYSTNIFIRAVEERLRKLLVALFIFGSQLIVFLLIMLPFFALTSFGDALTPKHTQNTVELENEIKEYFLKQYSIQLDNTDKIIHSSAFGAWQSGGYDLIIKVEGGISQSYAPKGSNFLISKKTDESVPFLDNNLIYLCENITDFHEHLTTAQPIKDKTIRNLICNVDGFPKDTLIAKKEMIGLDRRIMSVFFPSQRILWISETEW